MLCNAPPGNTGRIEEASFLKVGGIGLAGLRDLFLGLPGASEADLEWLGAGMDFSGRALIGATIETDLFESAPSLELPVYVIQGSDDLSAPTAPARSLVRRGQGAEKQFVVIEDAGHFALVTQRAKFIGELKNLLGS